MPKQTKLNEDAEIYQPRKQQSEKEKLRDMPFKKKLSYLWEYYRYHALVFVASVVLIIYVIYTIVKPNIETELYVALINNTFEDKVLADYKEKLAEHLALDPKKKEVTINSSFYFNGAGDYEMDMRQILITYVAAENVDIIIAPKSEFSGYAYHGFFSPLSDQLPTDLYSSLTNRYYISSQEEDPKEDSYGIILSDTDLFKNNAKFTEEDPYVLGIVANSQHKENSVEFIRLLFE